MSLVQVLRRSGLLLLAGSLVLGFGCRNRGISREAMQSLPPIEISEFNVDVRQSTCAHGVVDAAKALKPAIEKELERNGFTVVSPGQGVMSAKGTAMVTGCKGDGGVANVSLLVFSHDGRQLARAIRKAKLSGANEGAGINSANAAAQSVVALLNRSKHIKKYASQSHPDKKTAVATASRTNEKPEELGDGEPPAKPEPPVKPEPPPPVATLDPPTSNGNGPALNPDWVVAVMEVKDLNAGSKGAIGDDLIRNLGSQLRIELAKRGAKTVDKSAQDEVLREQVKEIKNDSYKTCYDDSCQVELGKALAASHILRSQVTRFGSRCVLNAELFDLRREVTIAASSSRGDCEPEGFLRMSEEVANGLRVQ
jgi:hypothetical protein